MTKIENLEAGRKEEKTESESVLEEEEEEDEEEELKELVTTQPNQTADHHMSLTMINESKLSMKKPNKKAEDYLLKNPINAKPKKFGPVLQLSESSEEDEEEKKESVQPLPNSYSKSRAKNRANLSSEQVEKQSARSTNSKKSKNKSNRKKAKNDLETSGFAIKTQHQQEKIDKYRPEFAKLIAVSKNKHLFKGIENQEELQREMGGGFSNVSEEFKKMQEAGKVTNREYDSN